MLSFPQILQEGLKLTDGMDGVGHHSTFNGCIRFHRETGSEPYRDDV
ncbi:hypothetical protein K788_0007803 [Paraburkholderia caribensis MBA4]|uniref:Uncharacterized protein n=1 Tax=Paraburkholderia caribensis MBA4 TaxID=1323664 RepID=A0A0N7JTR1_9BURK|nr:hypothetical protein K788_0007803 [Paraburkholderia caribensis MBA4]